MPDTNASIIERIAREAIRTAFVGDEPTIVALSHDEYRVPEDDAERVVVEVDVDRPFSKEALPAQVEAQSIFTREAGLIDPNRWYSLLFRYQSTQPARVA